MKQTLESEAMQRRGFSLLELSMVLLVSGLMLGFLTQMGATVERAECYTATRAQLPAINEAIQRFARKNDRLPMPAARNIGIEDINYGREALAAAITQGGGVSYGALPFQALGLSPSMAGDCWGNKFTYMVTTALTTNAASGGYLDATVLGNIARKSTAAATTDSAIAYAVVSHGMDELGAVELNYAGVSKGWCGGASNLKSMNCRGATAEVADAVLNDGKDAAANYFDDLVIAGGKPKILNDVKSNAYCWGYNGNGEVGDNTNTTPATSPTLVSGGIQFAQISTGSDHTCGLDITGKAYCWGANTYNQLGDGTNTPRLKPTAVNGGLTFKMIRAGYGNTCALTTAGAAYCWGYNGMSGALGLGHFGPASSPGLVTGGLTFADITVGFTDQCGVTTAGVGYCWGYNERGQLGVGDTTSRTSPTLVSGGLTFKQIKAAYDLSCGITIAGDAYCWGFNAYGQLGDGTLTESHVPVAVSGGIKFKEIHLQGWAVCGLSTDDVTYCWGDNQYNNLGKNTGVGYYTTPQTQAVGSPTFIQLTTQFFGGCGLTSDYKVYCWGRGNHGQIGDGTTNNAAVPTLVSGGGTAPYAFGTLGIRGYTSSTICALQPLPPAAWGHNGFGQVGDNSTTHRATPVYINVPSGVSYFKSASYGVTSCALSDQNKGYCWGLNDFAQVGDGTSGTNKLVPTKVTMPGAVTFTSMRPGNRWATCAMGNDSKPYCWGVGYYYGFGSSPTVPTILTMPPVTANKINLWGSGGAYLGSDGQAYRANGWAGVAVETLPGGVATVQEFTAQSVHVCILGNDNLIYCRGESGLYSAVGDGSVSGVTASYVPVTLPMGVTSFKSLSSGEAGGGWGYSCAIGNDDEGYCWGMGNSGVLGNGAAATVYVPTKMTRPAGVNKWLSVIAGDYITVAQGDDGNWYYAGIFDNSGAVKTFTPTLIPAPTGATGWRTVNGRIGIVY